MFSTLSCTLIMFWFYKKTSKVFHGQIRYIKFERFEIILSFQVFPGLIKLRKICNHPDIVFHNQEEEQQQQSSTMESGEDDDETRYGYWKRSGKMVVVESLLKMWKEKEHRVLLFSQSKQVINFLFVKRVRTCSTL